MSDHKEIQLGSIKNLQAESFLKLVKDHKRTCTGNVCTVSLYLLFPLYRQLRGEGAIQDMEHFV